MNKAKIYKKSEKFDTPHTTIYGISFGENEKYIFTKEKNEISVNNLYLYTIKFVKNGIWHKLFEEEMEEGTIPCAYVKYFSDVTDASRKIKEMFFLVEGYEHPDYVQVAVLDLANDKIFKTNENKNLITIYKSSEHTLIIEESHEFYYSNNREVAESTKTLYLNKDVKNRGEWVNTPTDYCVFTDDDFKKGKGWKNTESKEISKNLYYSDKKIYIEYKISEITRDEFLRKYGVKDYEKPEIRRKPLNQVIRKEESVYDKLVEIYNSTTNPKIKREIEEIFEMRDEKRSKENEGIQIPYIKVNKS